MKVHESRFFEMGLHPVRPVDWTTCRNSAIDEALAMGGEWRVGGERAVVAEETDVAFELFEPAAWLKVVVSLFVQLIPLCFVEGADEVSVQC